MKKLYIVEIERTIMVVADNDKEARAIALENENDEMDMSEPRGICVYDVDTENNPKIKASIPKDWMNCIPYGGNDDKTVQEILALK